MASKNNHSERKPLVGVIVAVGIAVLLFSGWMRFRSNTVPVRAEKVEREDITNVISTNGKMSRLAGDGHPCRTPAKCGDGGPALKARLNNPQGIAVRANIPYISHSGDNQVRRVTDPGQIGFCLPVRQHPPGQSKVLLSPVDQRH